MNLLRTAYEPEIAPPELPKLPAKPSDHAVLLAACERDSFDQARDRAFLQLLLTNAFTFKEVYRLRRHDLELPNASVCVTLDVARISVGINAETVTDLHVYLRHWHIAAKYHEHEYPRWLSESGQSLTYWAMYANILGLSANTGVDCNPRRFIRSVARSWRSTL